MIEPGRPQFSTALALTRVFFFATASLLAMWHVWDDILTIASRDEESTHIFLVPFVFAGIIWVRRDRLDLYRADAKWLGIFFIVAGAISHEVGLTRSIVVLFHFSAVLVFLGGLCFGLGLTLLRRYLPALVVLVFLVPVPGLIRQQLSLPLQYYSACFAHFVLSTIGVSIEQNGCILSLDGTDILVAEACNGMRMLMAVILSLFAFCFCVNLNWVVRTTILLLIPFVGLGLNCARILLTVVLFAFAPESVAVLFHDLSGWVIPVLIVFWVSGVPSAQLAREPRLNLASAMHHKPFLWRSAIPNGIGIGLFLAMLYVNFQTYPSNECLAQHHRQVERKVNSIPYAIGNWIATEKTLHDEEVELLKPFAAFRRVYNHLETDQKLTLFTVASKHARDLVGHEPGICFVGQGWEKKHESKITWTFDDLVINGQEYEFLPPDGISKSMRVFSILVTPTGATTGNTAELAYAASDCRLERFGALAVQILHSSDVTREQWRETATDFVAAFVPVIRQYQASTSCRAATRSLIRPEQPETAIAALQVRDRLESPVSSAPLVQNQVN